MDEDLVEDEEFCCARLMSRNVGTYHLCCKQCYSRNVYEKALAYYAEYENFIDFPERCMICREPEFPTIINEVESHENFDSRANSTTTVRRYTD